MSMSPIPLASVLDERQVDISCFFFFALHFHIEGLVQEDCNWVFGYFSGEAKNWLFSLINKIYTIYSGYN